MQSYLYVYAVLLYVFNLCNIITTKKNVCIKMANDLVVKNNALIDASYTLSLVEQRLIGLALVKANNQHQEITSDTVLTIHAGEYAEQFKVDGSVAYRALKEASERLFLRYFSYTLYGLEFGKEYTFKRPKS